jgi:putative DNA primase/helicase
VKSEEDEIPWAVLCHTYEESSKDEARQKVVERLVGTHDFAVDPESDELLRYSDETGIYEDDGGEYIRQLLEERLQKFNSEREANKIIYKLKQHPETRRDFTPPRSKVCIRNGVLDLSKPEEPKLHPHSPDHHFRTRMAVEFDETADSPRFTQFISEQVADRDTAKLQEFIGYIIGSSDRVLFQKALLLVGPTAAGKSTFLDAIAKLLGESNTSHLTLQQMADSPFALSKAHHAYANICNDLDTDAIQNTGRFKQLVAGDTVEANQKHKDHFRFEMTAKQVYATNRVPTLEGADDAVYRRWLHVQFPESVAREDRDKSLEDDLEDELSGILNWALEGYARLMRQDSFTGERSTEEKRDLWQGHGDSIDQFVSSNLGMSRNDREPKEKVYDAYTDFCHENELPVETKQKFAKRLKQEHDITTSRPTIDGERTRCYRGISLIEGPNPFSSTDDGPEEVKDNGGDDNRNIPDAFLN